MKTKINFNISINKVMSVALFLFLLIPVLAFGQIYPAPSTGETLVCDPLPEDTEKLLSCLDILGTTPVGGEQTVIYSGPGQGAHGSALAYNSTDDRLLVVSTYGNGSAIAAQMYDASTMAPAGGQFNIDQWPLFVGTPKVAYNPVNNNFLVIWVASHSNEQPYIYGRFVQADGSMPAEQFFIGGIGREPTLAYDSKNNRFVVEYERSPLGNFLVTVGADSAVGQPLSISSNTGFYEGMTAVAYNSNLNEYWYAYAWGVTGNDTSQEDDRIMFARVDASTMQKVGEPVQLSQTRIARNGFSHPGIAYSAFDGAAVVSWTEMGRTPGMASEVYGRTIYDNLTLSAEYPLLTNTTAQTSDFYGGSKNLSYNSYTGTFALAGEDNNGGTTLVEFLPSGTILDITEAVPPLGRNGNFVPQMGVVPQGYVVNAAPDYGALRFGVVTSPHRIPAAPSNASPAPAASTKLDTSTIAKIIAQIYVWSLGLAGMAAVVMVIIGGYLVMTARGNGQQVSQGREYVVGALTGLVLLIGAYLILNTINPDLVNFDLSSINTIR